VVQLAVRLHTKAKPLASEMVKIYCH